MKRLLVLATTFAIFSAPVANAHTSLVSTNPAKNAVLHASPKSITLTFNDPLIKIAGKNISWIKLNNSKGSGLFLRGAIVLKNKITLDLPTLAADKYKVSYRVVSNDGHPVSGSYFFTVK